MSSARAAARPRLRTRLIAWYAGTLCCVLLVAAVSVRFVVQRTLERAHEESITASIALFRQFFRVEIAEYRTVDATLAHIAGELIFEDRILDVRRPDGSRFEPPGDAVGRPGGAAARPQLRAPTREQTVALDPELAPGWVIEVQSSAATLAAASRRIDLWLLGGIPFVVLVAAILGWWLAGRALRPIGRMAGEARTLDATTGARLTLHDPTDELGRFGASFNAVLDRLHDAQRQQQRFLADAAHELRAPLARLRSRAELGRIGVAQAEGPAVRQEADTTLLALEREILAASEVVGGLLALARADAGAVSVAMREGFLDDVLSDELPRWKETAAEAGVQVELGTFEEVRARFDESLMRRLLGLLLDNAIHYSPAGTRVTVHLRSTDKHATLVVEDRGIGIPPEERTAVFRRFHRASAARARRAEGSGLGLSLASWIVAQHHGTIVARDRSDGANGVAIVVQVPLWPGTPAPHVVEEAMPTARTFSEPAVGEAALGEAAPAEPALSEAERLPSTARPQPAPSVPAH
jgi:two-component system, OmpR family, sensor kinase